MDAGLVKLWRRKSAEEPVTMEAVAKYVFSNYQIQFTAINILLFAAEKGEKETDWNDLPRRDKVC